MKEIAKAENVNESAAAEQFESLLPATRKLWPRYECNIKTWTGLLEACRERPGAAFLPSRKEIVACALSYLGILIKTSECERNFSTLQLIEHKRRERKCDVVCLTECVKIALEIPDDLEQLLMRAKTVSGHQDWKGRDLIQKAQELHGGFMVSERPKLARLKESRGHLPSLQSGCLPLPRLAILAAERNPWRCEKHCGPIQFSAWLATARRLAIKTNKHDRLSIIPN